MTDQFTAMSASSAAASQLISTAYATSSNFLTWICLASRKPCWRLTTRLWRGQHNQPIQAAKPTLVGIIDHARYCRTATASRWSSTPQTATKIDSHGTYQMLQKLQQESRGDQPAAERQLHCVQQICNAVAIPEA